MEMPTVKLILYYRTKILTSECLKSNFEKKSYLSGNVSATPSYSIPKNAFTDWEAACRSPLRAPIRRSGVMDRAFLKRLMPTPNTLHKQRRPMGLPKKVNRGC